MKVKNAGFPKIHNYPGDIREFTPNLFKYLDKFKNLNLYLESGYGERQGYSKEDYLKECPRIKFVEYEETLKQDIMIILKMPELKELEKLDDNSAVFTMIHYDTRPSYRNLFTKKNITTFSMDSIVDDFGIRMFVDYFGTAFSGCDVAVKVLKDNMKDFYSHDRKPIVASIFGAGGVGQGCVKALEVLSDKEFLNTNTLGILPQILTRTITSNEDALKEIFKETNLLIDATKRSDYSKQIINNSLLRHLPKDAVILDLSADRYDTTEIPPLVRAIEGTVKGSPNHMVINTDDKLYDEIPEFIDSTNRRIVVSSDAWPSFDYAKSINYYETLMRNYLNVLLTKDLSEISVESDNVFERGLYRSTVSYFRNN